MNPTIESLKNRKSCRQFEEKLIPADIKEVLLDSAFQAPTAGNQMLYSILDITDQALKDKLSETCDHQPFIAKAPIVLIFLADTKRWLDAYKLAGVDARDPGIGDLLLAIQDTVIAAHNVVVATESLGLGSCYIGDILENAEVHQNLLNLDPFVVPISMLVIGYPTESQRNRIKPARFSRQYIVHENTYRPLSETELRAMHAEQANKVDGTYDFESTITAFCKRKYLSEFALEMNRSSEVLIKPFL